MDVTINIWKLRRRGDGDEFILVNGVNILPLDWSSMDRFWVIAVVDTPSSVESVSFTGSFITDPEGRVANIEGANPGEYDATSNFRVFDEGPVYSFEGTPFSGNGRSGAAGVPSLISFTLDFADV